MENIVEIINEILSQDSKNRILVPTTRDQLLRFRTKIQQNPSQTDLIEWTRFMNTMSDEYEAALGLLSLREAPKRKNRQQQQQQQQQQQRPPSKRAKSGDAMEIN